MGKAVYGERGERVGNWDERNLVLVLFEVIKARDEATASHSLMMAKYNQLIATKFDPHNAYSYYLGGLVHDIGKVAMPDDILKTDRKITEEERSKIFAHVEEGDRILAKAGVSQIIHHTAKYHHERFDGSGYCHGLEGFNIPLCGRIAGIADTYATLLQGRLYKAAEPENSALDIMWKDVHMFDPKILTWFTQEITKT